MVVWGDGGRGGVCVCGEEGKGGEGKEGGGEEGEEGADLSVAEMSLSIPLHEHAPG